MLRTILHTIYSIALASCLALGACENETAGINGNITSLPDLKVYLCEYRDKVMHHIDSTVSHNGRFMLPIPEVLPNAYFLCFEGYPGYYLPVIIDGSNVYVSGNFNYHDDIKVSGTKPNDDLWNYRSSVRKFDIMLRAIDMGMEDYRDSTALANSARYISLTHKRDSIKRLITYMQDTFIMNNPSSILSAMFATGAVTDSSTVSEVKSYMERLDTVNMPDNAFLRRLHRQREAARK